MPKWLSALLIVAGFFALVGLAFFPRTIEVNIEIIDNSRDEAHYPGPHDEAAPLSAPEGDR
jgi:hypothetical protein